MTDSNENEMKNLLLETCSKCGTNKYKEIEILNNKMLVKIQCPCEEAEQLEALKNLANIQKEVMMAKCKNISIVDKKAFSETFDRAILKDNKTKEMMNLGEQYCLKFEKIMKQNTNLYIYGSTGVGKSYLSNCIYNYLSNKYTVLMINMPLYLLNLQAGYSKNDPRENEILQILEIVDLLIIDDLGREETNKWTLEKTLNIIEKRMNIQKPILISSNLDLNCLKEKYSVFDEYNRLQDRIKGSCLDIQYTGTSKRKIKEANEWLLQ